MRVPIAEGDILYGKYLSLIRCVGNIKLVEVYNGKETAGIIEKEKNINAISKRHIKLLNSAKGEKRYRWNRLNLLLFDIYR